MDADNQLQNNELNQTGMKRPLLASNGDAGMDYIPPKKPVDQAFVENFEAYPIPENAVGLVIGKGGTEIKSIQTVSGCRVQMSPDYTSTNGVRICQLAGTEEAKAIAKELISAIVAKTENINVISPGTQQIEMMISPDRCGLIIGKNGETIKLLQEQSGCRMNVIQDSNAITGNPKPLRMIGTPEQLEVAKQLVMNVLDKPGFEVKTTQHNPSGHHGYAGGMESQMAKGEVIVPRTAAGMIIGRGGETIRRLALETGTKIQFKPDENPHSDERCAVIMGTRDQIYMATEKITEIVNKAVRNSQVEEVFFMHVPAQKCGLVIGKGGETIRQIEKETGASCALAKDVPHANDEKVFEIRGAPSQINHASHIVRIKVGDIPPNTPIPSMSNEQQNVRAQHGYTNSPQQVQPAVNTGYTVVAQTQQPQQYVPQGQWAVAQPQQQVPVVQAYQQPIANPMETYAYQQQPKPVQAVPIIAQQIKAEPTAPTLNPATGLPDYSAQWAAYYRSIGLPEQAAMVEGQMKLRAAETATVPVQQQQQSTQYTYATPKI